MMNNSTAAMSDENNSMDAISTMLANYHNTQAYFQTHGHAKNIFALFSEEDQDDSQESGVTAYEC